MDTNLMKRARDIISDGSRNGYVWRGDPNGKIRNISPQTPLRAVIAPNQKYGEGKIKQIVKRDHPDSAS